APELKHHERPQQMTVVVRSGLVLPHELPHVARIEEPLRGKTARTQQLMHERIPFVGQPMLHGHAETFLAALEHRLGQCPGEGALEDPFALAAAYLEL